jgi:hypothetical protein
MAQWRWPIHAAAIATIVAATYAQVFAGSLASGAVPPGLEQFAALVSKNAEGQQASASKFKPLECEDLGGADSPAFRSCFLVEESGCFHVQTQAEDRDPSIYAFQAHSRPSCSAAGIARGEAAFLEVFLSCGGADLKAKAVADFLAQPVDLSVQGAYELYSDYVNQHDAYPGYQLKDNCPGMAGVNIHDVLDGFPHRGIALYDLSKSSQTSLPKPKAN